MPQFIRRYCLAAKGFAHYHTNMIDMHAAAITPPVTIYRGDYAPPDWLVPNVTLAFHLGIAETRVSGTLRVVRNGSHDRPLVLDSDGTVPADILIDGVPALWSQDGDRIIIAMAGDAADVAITTIINPATNTQLMGLYASGGMLCTQCEAQGFRRIIPFVDRPDVLSIYTVQMRGSAADFPVLLSNGECMETGPCKDDDPNSDPSDHYAVWHDPWPKPSYLFALVAGNLVANRDSFTTASGKAVDLAIWVRDSAELSRTAHAMAALKNSMAWDERVYGREYDLGVFNIVAVSDFNMGAMENKGLNIFNTRYVLADPETATDMDFDGVEGVIAHEYFHNWSGNRVTCRDWFQLSLKEGFTVYRDQCFSADMGSAAVKRIEDVRLLRAIQFPEDGGPLAHPVRPESFQEISNFYTATVYNKGAEVIRMMALLLGPKAFRRGTDLYFARHDGQAVTCEDFVRAMEDANPGSDAESIANLAQFRLWYSQAGTPKVTARLERADNGHVTLHVAQSVPPTPGQSDKAPMLIPLRIKLYDLDGGHGVEKEQLILLNAADMKVECGVYRAMPVMSFNRGFSAPVISDVARASGDLQWLAAHDDDPFARYEALQHWMIDVLVAQISGREDVDTAPLISAIGAMLEQAMDDPAFVAEAVSLPSEAFLGDQMLVVDPDAIRQCRRALQADIGAAHAQKWQSLHSASATDAADLSPKAKGLRKIRSSALAHMMAQDAAANATLAHAQYAGASGMTDRISALATLSHYDVPQRDAALADFHARYHANPLVLDKWFQLQAFAMRDDVVESVQSLAAHPDFTLANPNRVRSLYGAFSANQAAFHRADGAGYTLMADLIITLDRTNPQTAARMVPPFGRWQRFDEARASMMQAAIQRILDTPGLSRDVFEQASKSLNG